MDPKTNSPLAPSEPDDARPNDNAGGPPPVKQDVSLSDEQPVSLPEHKPWEQAEHKPWEHGEHHPQPPQPHIDHHPSDDKPFSPEPWPELAKRQEEHGAEHPPAGHEHTPPKPSSWDITPAKPAEPPKPVAETWHMPEEKPMPEPAPASHTNISHSFSAPPQTPEPAVPSAPMVGHVTQAHMGPPAPVAPQTPHAPQAPLPAFEMTGDGRLPTSGIHEMVAASAMNGTAKRSKKGKLMGLFAFVAILILGIGSAAAYVGFYLPNQPDMVLTAALANSFSKDVVKSSAFEGEFSITNKDGKTQPGVTSFHGASNQSGAFTLTGSVDVLVTNVTFDMRSVDGSSYYFKVGGLDGLPDLLKLGSGQAAAYGNVIKAINSQWFSINSSMVKQFTGQDIKTQFSDADRQKLVKAYKNNPILVVKQQLADQAIQGHASHHYRVVVDKDKLRAFVVELKNAKLDAVKFTDTDIKDLDDGLKNAKFNDYPVDVWISASDKLFRQFQFSATQDDQTANIRLTFTDYNQNVKVDKPENSKSLLELISLFFGGVDPNMMKNSDPSLMQALQGISL